ncbi:hypothetical protein CDD83_4407 [Cordyceps sp. RAO-2017]|nr:hypothetical protein CDD83_4407 [Cordyceps sp. RAO-2017]
MAATATGGPEGTVSELGGGPAEQDVAAGDGDLVADAEVCVGQHGGQEDLVVGAVAELAQQQRLGDEEGERVDGEPDVDELRLLALAVLGEGVAAERDVVEHGLGVVVDEAGEEEAGAAVLDVVAAQGAELVRDEAD